MKVYLAIFAIVISSCSHPISRPVNSTNDAIADKIVSNVAVPTEVLFLNLRSPLIVQIRLKLNGQFHEVKLKQSSGNKHFDEAIMNAVRKSNPLPIPDEEREKYTDFEIEFE